MAIGCRVLNFSPLITEILTSFRRSPVTLYYVPTAYFHCQPAVLNGHWKQGHSKLRIILPVIFNSHFFPKIRVSRIFEQDSVHKVVNYGIKRCYLSFFMITLIFGTYHLTIPCGRQLNTGWFNCIFNLCFTVSFSLPDFASHCFQWTQTLFFNIENKLKYNIKWNDLQYIFKFPKRGFS